MDIKARLAKTKSSVQEIHQKLQFLEQEKQQLLQEILRLDGEHRLLMELQKELEIKP